MISLKVLSIIGLIDTARLNILEILYRYTESAAEAISAADFS